jgi:hypothetical protein
VSDHLRDLAYAAALARERWYGPESFPVTPPCGRFIAACDPQTILSLLDERDRLRGALRALYGWVGVYDDHMGPSDFARRNDAVVVAREALTPSREVSP